MPLTWDITKCKDPDFISKGNEWAITNVVIMGTIFTGIGLITDENAGEFYARIHLIELMGGNLLLATNSKGEKIERSLTPIDIFRRIGLRTNAAFKDETRAQFNKRHVKHTLDMDARNFRTAVERDFTGTSDQFRDPDAVADVA